MQLKTTLVLFLSIFCANLSFAQEISPCSTDEVNQEYFDQHPSERAAILKAKEELSTLSFKYQKEKRNEKSNATYIIPVVFHVLHQNGPENISDEQIFDAVRIINEDFRKLNPDTSIIVPTFQSIAADTKIEFRLAKLDPNGNCTNGIDRILSNKTFEKSTNDSKLNQWPRDKYLNIWVVASINSGAAGYAYYPHSTVRNPSIDGIMILSQYVGSIGSGNGHRSRALTHEIGHYLNLKHTWGDSNSPAHQANCSIDDDVFDTPLTMGHTSCNLSARTCDTTLDNVQNYMDYSYCSKMYTQGQANRMQATLNSGTVSRSNLHSLANLIATGVLDSGSVCEANFEADKKFACVADTVIFFDKSYHNPLSWVWDLQGSASQFYYDSIVEATYVAEGVYDVTLTVSDSSKSVSKTKTEQLYIFDTIADYSGTGYLQDFDTPLLPTEWLYLKSIFSNRFERGIIGKSSAGSIFVHNFTNTNPGEKFEMISPAFDLSSLHNPKLIFDYAYTNQNAADRDKLEVHVSTDCGKSWQIAFTYSGALMATAPSLPNQEFIPDTTQWRSFTIPLSTAAKNSDNVLFKFSFTTAGGNNFYLDNIQVDGLVGLQENKVFRQAHLYPNPTSNDLNLVLALDNTEAINLELFDIRGKKIKEVLIGEMPAGNHKIRIKTEELTSGMFFVKISASGRSHSLKFIKK